MVIPIPGFLGFPGVSDGKKFMCIAGDMVSTPGLGRFPMATHCSTHLQITWIIEKASEFKKIMCFYFIDYNKIFDCVDHIRLWKILQELLISDHLTCLLSNLYAGQEATLRIGYGFDFRFSDNE